MKPQSTQNIRSIVSNKEIQQSNLEYAWQEFVLERQESLCSKMDDEKTNINIKKLLNMIDDKKIVNQLNEEITKRESNIVYINYNRGFIDGIRTALALSKI
jgi:hypothetical protein